MPIRAFVTALLFLLASLALPAAASAQAGLGGPAARHMERDLGGAFEHVAALRERLAGPPGIHAGAEAAGIADGRFATTVSGLRQTSRGLERRFNKLRSAADGADYRKREILLLMQVELRSLQWLIDELEFRQSVNGRESTLDRIERGLEEIDGALAALGTLETDS